MSRTVILTVLLVLSGCSWTPAGGQRCSLSCKKIYSENVLQAIVTIFTGTAYNQPIYIYIQLLNFHSPLLLRVLRVWMVQHMVLE